MNENNGKKIADEVVNSNEQKKTVTPNKSNDMRKKLMRIINAIIFAINRKAFVNL